MTTFRAHFDGHVFVPDEPVNLPPDRDVELQVRELEHATSPKTADLPIARDPITGFPYFCVPPGAKPITLEDIKRAEDEL